MSVDLEATGIEGLEEDVPKSLVERLDEANQRYREVVVSASDGNPAAVAEARGLELQISGLLDEAKREAIAKQMRERQALADREEEMRESQARDRDSYAALIAKRDQAFALALSRLAAFASSARRLFEAEADAQDMAGRAGERFISERVTLSNCVAVVGGEVNLEDPPIGWVPAMQRKRLLERFPDLLAPEPISAPSSDRCSICAHGQRSEIEAALGDGLSYREAAGLYGVSRSAITRHMRHAT